MQNIKRDLNDILNVEAKQYGLYTLTNRAIPHLIDGFKPSHRFIMASALKDAGTSFTKVASIAGNVSKYGYAHGENSAGEAGVLMASDWSNNVNVLEGRGNFGSRIIKDAAASRYIYAKVHSNFNALFKDMNQNYEHPDTEIKIPQFYVPVLPIVLSNGITGIATGFKTNILPHSTEWLFKASKEYAKTGDIKSRPVVEFPSFKGTVVDNNDGSYTQIGVYETLSPLQIKITEIPTNSDWEKYTASLDKLQDEGKIVSWEDGTGEHGFEFTVKLKRDLKINANETDKINKLFKLEFKQTQLINIVTPGSDINNLSNMYTLKTYEDARDVVKDFVDWIMANSLPKRISMNIDEIKSKIDYNTAKIKFISDVNDNTLDLSKTTKKELAKIINSEYTSNEKSIEQLLRIPVYGLTKDEAIKAKEELVEFKKSLEVWKCETPATQLLSDLESLSVLK